MNLLYEAITTSYNFYKSFVFKYQKQRRILLPVNQDF